MNELGYVLGQQSLAAAVTGEDRTFSLLGREWDQLGEVFGGEFMQATAFFTSWLPYPDGGSFLEMGAGSGVTTVMAAVNGCASVTAVDINPAAADNVLLNAKRHGVADRVRAFKSDVFSALREHDTFDVIYWNSNFIESPRDSGTGSLREAAVFDPGYRAHREFIRDAPAHLNEGGSVFLGFSAFTGNEELVFQLAREAGLTGEVFRQEVFDVPPSALGTGQEFEAAADENGLLHPDFTLLVFRRAN